MKAMKLGSLFDGSGGFPLAGSLCGIEPVWAAEVEPYPIAVTRSRFPDMKHLGSVTDIKGGDIEPVDIITFGSPCQDLSVAGKRAGLKHEANGDEETTRSGLFMEAVRIIKEMRKATNGEFNACSKLYGACCKIGFEMGYKKIITYTLESEGGASLRASGFRFDGEAGGKQWTGKRRRDYYICPEEMKSRWIKERRC